MPGEIHMKPHRPDVASNREPCAAHDWNHLLRKLRWIGLDDEAKHLELVLSALPAEERCSPMAESTNTD
jgi:hypothetical protein